MYSLQTRLNTVFFYGTVCIFILCGFNILTTIHIHFQEQPLVNKFEILDTSHLYYHNYLSQQQAINKFSLDCDVTPIVNWNTNLIFLWITAEYESKRGPVVVTVYDRIIQRSTPEKYQFSVSNIEFDYPLVDLDRKLHEKTIKYKLKWEHMPVVGPILKGEISLTEARLSLTKEQPVKRNMLQDHYEYHTTLPIDK